MTTLTCPQVETPMDAIRAHARRIAAMLPPFTAEEAQAVGRIAAALDTKRAVDRITGRHA